MADRDLRIRMLLEAGDRFTKPLRDLAGGSTKAERSLKATRDRLKEIGREQKSIATFRKLKEELLETKPQLEAARARVNAIGREMGKAGAPTEELTRKFRKAKEQAAALEERYGQTTSALNKMRFEASKAGKSMSTFADDEVRLRIEAGKLNAELDEQKRRMIGLADRSRRMSAAREGFGRNMNAATGLAAGGFSAIETGRTAGAPVFGAVKSAMEYQSVMTDIAQKANLSREEARKMGLGLLAAAKAANQMPDALQEGVETLAGFGLDPRKAVAMMKPIGRAATAYKAEIKDLSSAAFAANDNLKVPIEQTGRVIDIMAQAGKSGAFEIKDMAQYFPTLTAAAQGLGQKGAPAVADLAAALQIARKGTGDSASAATNVANLLQKMNSPDAIKKFEKFGVDLPAALERAYKAGKTPIEAIAELTNKTLGGDLSRLGFLFEDAQVQQALRPLIQNIDEYKRIRADAFGAKGVTDADFAERLQDGAEKAKAFSVQAKVLGLTMGAALLPTATALLTKLTGFATWLGDLATRYPQAAKWAGLLAGGFAALMIVLGAVGIAAAGVMAPFAALGFAATLAGTTQAVLWAKFGRALMFPLRIFPLLGRGIAWVGGLALRILPMIGRAAMMMATGVARAGLFLLANPMILAIVALVAIVAGAAYLIWKHWDTIKAAFFGAVAWMGEAWSAIRARFAAGVAAIGGFFGSLWQGLRSGVGNILAFLGALPLRFAEFGRNMIMGMISGITGMLGALKSTIVNAASSAANWFKQKLGIHSPSRVFMAFGGHIADGLAIGIQRGASEPIKRVHRLSRDVAAAMVIGVAAPAVASAGIAGGASKGGAGGAFGGGGDRYEIHLHAAPGMSEDQLIAKLEQKLREIAAGKAARARKSYADEQDG